MPLYTLWHTPYPNGMERNLILPGSLSPINQKSYLPCLPGNTMATSFHFVSPRRHLHTHRQHQSHLNFFIIKCKAQDTNPPSSDRFKIVEKQRKSEIIRDRKAEKGIVKLEPKNFEIGWKRTKEIKLEKPKGYMIMDFLEKFEGLIGREYGSVELLDKTGEIVAERAREEAEVLREGGEVEEKLITELFRVLRLMEMDLAMVKAAVKEDTLKDRLQQAKARCRQAILVASSF